MFVVHCIVSEEVCIPRTVTILRTQSFTVQLRGHVGHGVQDVLVHVPVEAAPAGVEAVQPLGDAAGAGGHAGTRGEQAALAGHGHGRGVEVGDVLTRVLVLAQLPALRHAGHLQDGVDDVVLGVFTLNTLGGTAHWRWSSRGGWPVCWWVCCCCWACCWWVCCWARMTPSVHASITRVTADLVIVTVVTRVHTTLCCLRPSCCWFRPTCCWS